jgi:hypothetical protein
MKPFCYIYIYIICMQDSSNFQSYSVSPIIICMQDWKNLACIYIYIYIYSNHILWVRTSLISQFEISFHTQSFFIQQTDCSYQYKVPLKKKVQLNYSSLLMEERDSTQAYLKKSNEWMLNIILNRGDLFIFGNEKV